MSDVDAAMAQAGVELATLAAKNVAALVSARISSIRSKKDADEVRNAYEEIINELVADRAQAIAIAQAYKDRVDGYEISDGDIEYLQESVRKALEILGRFSPSDELEGLGELSDLISVETLKTMQLLGFDYKAAIGDPLTRACAAAIEAKLKVKPSGSQRRKS